MSSIEQTLQKIRDEVARSGQELRRVVEASEARILLKIEEYKNRINCLERENSGLRTQIEILEGRSKKNNIVAFGLNGFQLSPESISEKLNSLLDTNIKGEDINDVYSLSESQNGPIKIEFVSYQVKISVLNKRSKLKGTSVYLNHDLTKKQQEDNRTLRKFWRELKQDEKVTCYIRGNKLYIDGKFYTVQELVEEERLREICEYNKQHNSAPNTPTPAVASQELYGHTTDAEIPENKDGQVFEDTVSIRQEADNQKPATPKTSAPKNRNKSVTSASNALVKDKLRARPQK